MSVNAAPFPQFSAGFHVKKEYLPKEQRHGIIQYGVWIKTDDNTMGRRSGDGKMTLENGDVIFFSDEDSKLYMSSKFGFFPGYLQDWKITSKAKVGEEKRNQFSFNFLGKQINLFDFTKIADGILKFDRQKFEKFAIENSTDYFQYHQENKLPYAIVYPNDK
jgi:hypothetical protein